MKMKIFFICLFISSVVINATGIDDIQRAVNNITESKPPFDIRKAQYTKSFGISNEDNIIPDRMYDDFQLSQYVHASDFDDAGLSMDFKIKVNNHIIGVISCGGILESESYSLVTIDANYKIIDAIEVSVSCYCPNKVYAKQFRITGDGIILINRVIPIDKNLVLFQNFSQFAGYITETAYQIDNNGKFVKKNERKCTGTRVFTKQQLESKNLWDLY